MKPHIGSEVNLSKMNYFRYFTSLKGIKKLTRNEILKKVIEIQAAKFENYNLYVRASLHGGGGPLVGEVTRFGG